MGEKYEFYDVTEKKAIILECTGLSDVQAWRMAYELDLIPVKEIKKLIEAMKIIVEGKKE